MCRMLAYAGPPVLLDHLIVQPDSSLVHQVIDAKMLAMLNLAGFGLAAWDDGMADPVQPLLFRSTEVAIFDPNLRSLAAKLNVRMAVAHLRGIPYSGQVAVNRESLHPFRMPGSPLVMAHNGDLADFAAMRYDLVEHIRPDIRRAIPAMTDSAWLHALILSGLSDPAGPFTADEILRAVDRALTVIREVRNRLGIRRSSSVNLTIADGRNLIGVRFTYDFGVFEKPPFQGGIEFLSLWYTLGARYGRSDGEWKMTGGPGPATIIASEPLTRDVSTWVEVPEYSALLVEGGKRRVVALDV